MTNFSKDFPLLKNYGKKLIYADNAATTQKPKVMINKLTDFYTKTNANVHRGLHKLSEKATQEYEQTRKQIAKFFGAKEKEIIFTRGTTTSINMLAFGLEHTLKQGDEIVLSDVEHHANLVPWQELSKRKKLKLKFIPYDKDYILDLKAAKKLITNKTKIVSIAHISNLLGSINPVKEIGKIAKKNGAKFILDCAQSAPHMKLSTKILNCDAFVLSSHKTYGPTGLGILCGKEEFLDTLKPFEYGGDMIDEVFYTKSTYNELPLRLEAGTPPIAQVIAFGSTCKYLEKITFKIIQKQEKELTSYALKQLKKIKQIKLYGSKNSSKRTAVFSFDFKGIHPHDVSVILDKYGIAVRAGHHCAMPLNEKLGVVATTRISLCFYNTKKEVDKIIKVLGNLEKDYKKGLHLQ